MGSKTTDWRPGPTVCRCCLSEGCYKDISTEYFWMGKREVYAEMLSETFSLSIAYSQSGGPNSNSRLICEPCISRLRDASDFRKQVQECEKTFMQYLDPGTSVAELEVTVEPVDTQVKVERVKLEKAVSDDDFDDRTDFREDDDDDDDLDDQPLTKLASKVPKKESVDILDLLDNAKVGEKRKSSSKAKTPVTKKSKTKKEAKATSSKAPKPEKKKKEPDGHVVAKRNAEVILQYSTVYPFRLRGNTLHCVYCREVYEDPAEYRTHLDENHQEFTVSTAFAHCGSRQDYLKVDITDLKCRLCGEPFDDINQVAKHIYDWHEHKSLNLKYDVGMQPFKMEKGNWGCYICDKKLPSLTTLGRHMTAHYQKFTCDVCGRNYLSNEALRYHMRCSHSGKHSCRKCWTEFSDLETKREHIKASKPCWPFVCVHCRERFLSWEMKQKHLVHVHGRPKKTYECPDCNKVFENRRNFYLHYKLSHTEDSFICSCCGQKFANKKMLDDHRLGHTGEKLFKCSVCAKTFSREKTLKQHMWIHSENKRFACLLCDKQFAQKVSFKGHMKSHHPNVIVEF